MSVDEHRIELVAHDGGCSEILADADHHLLAESIGELLALHPQSNDDIHARAVDLHHVGVHLIRLSEVLNGSLTDMRLTWLIRLLPHHYR